MLYPDGTNAVISPENGRYFTLAEKRRLVPGSVHEIIFFNDRWSALASQSSMAEYNEHATRWMDVLTDGGRRLFGPVMIFRNEEFLADQTDGSLIDKIQLERHRVAQNITTIRGAGHWRGC